MDDRGWLRRAAATKRDGGALDAATWGRVVDTVLAGDADDAPIAALLMACVLRGMTDDETAALTEAMTRSGETLAFDAPVVDKHSTGGVGDAVSLLAVPLVAACGVPVAKLSGRALGHTGGTLDKLEAIPGVRTDLAPDALRAQVARIGCAIAGGTARLAPADRRLYALRDRTATVPSEGLIAASIVAKKLAAGAAAIVYDVKIGSGAFLADAAAARALAATLVRLTARAGRRASALVTEMDEPLGRLIGSGVEAVEARDALRGGGDERLVRVATVVAAEMLRLGGVDDGAERVAAALASGAAAERFAALVEAQGGTRAALDRLAPLPVAATVTAERDGWIGAFDTPAIGEAARDAVVAAGPFAGLRVHVRRGARVARGEPLLELLGDGGGAARLRAAIRIDDGPPPPRPLVAATLRDDGASLSNEDGG